MPEIRNFEQFQASAPARSVFRKLDLLDYLEAATSLRRLRELIVELNGADEGNFVALVRACDGVSSSGERVLLHAICYVSDFDWLADELANGYARGGTWTEPYNLRKGMTLTGDYQFFLHPAFNMDRGPVSIFAGRLHVEF
jgi:hypothetical protein